VEEDGLGPRSGNYFGASGAMWSAAIASGFTAVSSAKAALVKATAHSATQAIAGITKFSLDVMERTFLDATRLQNRGAS
jgi:hypothetical protein